MTAPDAPSGDTPPYREYDELRSLQNMVDRSQAFWLDDTKLRHENARWSSGVGSASGSLT
jgi:hypothetical protein